MEASNFSFQVPPNSNPFRYAPQGNVLKAPEYGTQEKKLSL